MSSKIPAGWEFVTSETTCDNAWSFAVEYKRLHEKVHADVFVRVKVVHGDHGAFWILRRLETRVERVAA